MIKMHPQIHTRRDVIFGAAGLAAFSIIRPRFAAAQDNPTAPSRDYVEHRIARGEHKLYAREWEGKGPALVLLHGFPDNLHIYDELAPLLARAGRRVVSFDFLGFGASDKPEGFAYNFKQHVDDLAVVADALKLETFIPVAHDAGGPAAINYALDHRKRVAAMVLLNSFYADAPTLKFPELIELFSDPDLKDLGLAFLGDRSKLEWLLTFQNHHFEAKASPELRARFDTILQPIVNSNFAQKPSAGPAFVAMTGDLRTAVAANSKRVRELKSFKAPVRIVWGMTDPYLNRGVAQDFAARFPNASLGAMETAGHWPQIDLPQETAELILKHVSA